MNNKKKLQIKVIIKLLIVIIFASLYAWGGIEAKWLRRFAAPFILTASMFFYSKRDWRTFIQLPLMFTSLSLGYGGNFLWGKIFKRGLFGLVNGITSSGYN